MLKIVRVSEKITSSKRRRFLVNPEKGEVKKSEVGAGTGLILVEKILEGVAAPGLAPVLAPVVGFKLSSCFWMSITTC